MQSSIATWLKKPTAVQEPISTEQYSSTTESGIPTPPPEETYNNESTKHEPHPSTNVADALSTKPLHALPRPLHPNISVEPCSKSSIPGLKRLNTLLLPIPYTAKFYDEILSDDTIASITLVALWHDKAVLKRDQSLACDSQVSNKVVGAIRCRLLSPPASGCAASPSRDTRMLYISTLGVLSPYQGHGIATQLLDTVLARAIKDYNVSAVGAHVWEASAEAREWYAKRGFVEERVEEAYYRRLEPKGAVVVRREVSV